MHIKDFYRFLFPRPHNIRSAMAANKKQINKIVPAKGEYATLVHPSIPSMIPAANTMKVMALFAFSVINSPP